MTTDKMMPRGNKKQDFSLLREDFPLLQTTNHNRPLVYLDSASTSQKPQQVISALSTFYARDYANIHRGIYELSERASQLYDASRLSVKTFINASYTDEIVFVRGTTEGINLVAQSMGKIHFRPGDEVILSEMEHHSNIVPWYLLKEQRGIALKVIPITDTGEMDLEAYQKLFSTRTKMVAINHASNVIGTINPVKEMTTIAHAHQVPVLIDGAQAVPHFPVDVQAIDCDFYVFSGHKSYGPTGAGVLYGKRPWLEKMPPYQGGGGMIETVSFSRITYAKTAQKFEAGTQDLASVIGLNAALHYLDNIGMEAIGAHDQYLLTIAEKELSAIPGLRLIGTARSKVGVLSFVMDKIHPHDIGTVLDHEGVAIRAGHHCAMPLMERFKVPATVRVSFGLYNTEKDIEALISAIQLAKRLFS